MTPSRSGLCLDAQQAVYVIQQQILTLFFSIAKVIELFTSRWLQEGLEIKGQDSR